MTEEKVLEFFDKSIPVCAKSSDRWLQEYNDVLKNVLSQKSAKTVKAVHTIRIKTVAANLGLAVEKLESRTFKMAGIFNNPKQYGSLPKFLHMVYGEDIDSYERYEQLSKEKECEWIAMSIFGETPIVGLYSRQRMNGQTDLVGVVHEVSDEPTVLSEQARAFSRRLVEEIGPMI